MTNGQVLEEFKPDRQIEVTEQMIAAGVSVLQGVYPHGSIAGEAQRLAHEVFVAMSSVSAKHA